METTLNEQNRGYKTVARLTVLLLIRDDLRKWGINHTPPLAGLPEECKPWPDVVYQEELTAITERIEYARTAIRENPIVYGWVRRNAWALMSAVPPDQQAQKQEDSDEGGYKATG